MNPSHAQSSKKLKVRQFIIPACLVVYGVSSYQQNGYPSSYQVKSYRDQQQPNFNNHLDDVLVFVPVVLNYGLSFAGVKSHSDFGNRSIIYIKAAVISMASVNLLKYSTRILRPDSSAFNSFPSGHTAFAFAMATVMDHELREQSIWYSVLGYGCATSVGAMRILNNRHWFSDVLVGAGIGIASGQIASLTHKYHWGNIFQGSEIVPVFYSKQVGFSFTKIF